MFASRGEKIYSRPSSSLYSAQNEQPLSDSQISYLDENEQVLNQVQTQDGWSVELRSVQNKGK